MRLRKYTLHQLQDAVKCSTSMRQVLQRLNIAAYGGNYDVLRKAIRTHGIDISHFSGQGWNKGRKLPPKQPIERYLQNTFPIQSYKLKNRLLREGMLPQRCMRCGGTHWLDQLIPLELDHINGDNKDNRLANLRLLCPNCHALTPTYRNRKIPRT